MEDLAFFAKLAKEFGIKGDVTGFEVVRYGHINGTFDVATAENGKEKHYFFQRVNTYVFKEPQKIMSNIAYVTTHIAKKLAAAGEDENGVMHFLTARDGKNYTFVGDDFWRVSVGVPDAVTINECPNADIFRSSGAGFGRFQTLLSDFDAKLLFETIPNFHNTRARIEKFREDVKKDPVGRVKDAAYEIAKIEEFAPLATRLCDMLDAGELPLRVTHNDTKINNILFDKNTLRAKTVIDLDTVMPGLVAHDFGDSIRFGANTAKEDEPDLSKVALNMDYFRAYTEGFLSEVGGALTENEIGTLALGAFTMTQELVVRFLDDYLVGDTYFKIQYPTHNLVRARCQLRLAEDMAAHLDEMNAIVAEIANR